MKRLIAVAGAVGLALALAACGGGSASSAGGSSGSGSPSVSGAAAVCALVMTPISQGWASPQQKALDSKIANAGGTANASSLNADLNQFSADWTSSNENPAAPVMQTDFGAVAQDCLNLGYKPSQD